MDLSYDDLTQETDRVIRANRERAIATSDPVQKRYHEDVALGAFILWLGLAGAAALRGQGIACQLAYDRDKRYFEVLTKTNL